MCEDVVYEVSSTKACENAMVAQDDCFVST